MYCFPLDCFTLGKLYVDWHELNHNIRNCQDKFYQISCEAALDFRIHTCSYQGLNIWLAVHWETITAQHIKQMLALSRQWPIITTGI